MRSTITVSEKSFDYMYLLFSHFPCNGRNQLSLCAYKNTFQTEDFVFRTDIVDNSVLRTSGNVLIFFVQTVLQREETDLSKNTMKVMILI